MQAKIQEVAELIAQAENIIALTGAGLSVESGIPAFRGSQGLWDKYQPAEYATASAFRANPGKVWNMFKEMDDLILDAAPNPAHVALAQLEKMGRLTGIVTQNVDGLHQAAGSKVVVEFHGSGRRMVCASCGRLVARHEMFWDQLPPLCSCGGIVRPDVVLFEEPIPEREALTAFALAQDCQVFLVAGTSAVVAPASHLPVLAKQRGAKVVEINLEPTSLSMHVTDHMLMGSASQVLPSLVEAVKELMDGSH